MECSSTRRETSGRTGRRLLKWWDTEEKVRELVSLGHLQKLGDEKSTVAFSRDRGERLSMFRGYSLLQAEMTAKLYSFTYVYVFSRRSLESRVQEDEPST